MSIKFKDFKYIFYATLFSFLVFGLIVPFAQDKIIHLSPYIQFLVFNIGIFVFLNLFLKSVLEGETLHLRESFGLLFLFLALDINTPPLAVLTNGTLNSIALLSGAGSDYVLGTLFNSLGFHGFLTYILVYIIAPFIFFVIATWLLKGLVKRI